MRDSFLLSGAYVFVAGGSHHAQGMPGKGAAGKRFCRISLPTAPGKNDGRKWAIL